MHISINTMDRTSEFSRVLSIFAPTEDEPEKKRSQPIVSPFLGIAMRVNSNLDSNDLLVNKMISLADRKEFSNDPSSAMAEISEVFNKKAHSVQHDLAIMKKNVNDTTKYSGSGTIQQQQHFKFILEALNKRQASHVTSFQMSAKKHAVNVEQRNKRVGKYGQEAPSTGNGVGGSGQETKESYAMFNTSGPSLSTRVAPTRPIVSAPVSGIGAQPPSALNNSVGLAAAPRSCSSLKKVASPPGFAVAAPPVLPGPPHTQGLPPSGLPPSAATQITPAQPPSLTLPSQPPLPLYTEHIKAPSTAAGDTPPAPPPRWNTTTLTAAQSPPGALAPVMEDYSRPVNTYTSRRRPQRQGQGLAGELSTNNFQQEYTGGYGDGGKYGNSYTNDGYQNPKMAQQKRDRSRLKGAEQVEAALAQMGSLFQQVATMVLEQGEVLTRIEDDIEGGLEEVKAGHAQMEKFYELSKQSRGTILILTGVMTVFVIFFLYVR